MDIHLRNITMKFQDVYAVQNINTTIKSGQLVSLLGPSGCGKSTTLMLLSGLYKPTSGDIYFGDKNVTNMEAEDRKIGMVFQSYALYPHLSVLKNIMFPLRMEKVPKKEAKERAQAMTKLMHIEHLQDRKPGQLSGGQQQRVAIARALVKEPKLLLLDEPLSNLDARLRLEMREEIRRIQQEIGITAVFVTHDQEEALSISDHVLLMKDGVIQQHSKPQSMYRYPCNRFAAKFLGNPPINLIETKHGQTQEKLHLHTYNQTKQILAAEQRDVTIGLRPEDLYVSSKENHLISGQVIHMETIGRDTMIRVQLQEETVRALIHPDATIQVGQTCYLGIKEENIHYFNTETGIRLTSHEGGSGNGS
ncbi:ABC transporter ATP-binding protein [Pontibacillus litoralis]|uniref:Sugar ABC transporter ATPase n=1 Tax=Pontibacillus litoralis JSM 072002 TaxID=1385512 RepID=A0A0A5HUJ6_9BACI|nr:ABC transporter ATP-binding protein [Pontibacillus litoralis]KGX87312.1 sugar ABC transporter ATPase [Pontibacillus litoralis JSM 072002]